MLFIIDFFEPTSHFGEQLIYDFWLWLQPSSATITYFFSNVLVVKAVIYLIRGSYCPIAQTKPFNFILIQRLFRSEWVHDDMAMRHFFIIIIIFPFRLSIAAWLSFKFVDVPYRPNLKMRWLSCFLESSFKSDIFHLDRYIGLWLNQLKIFISQAFLIMNISFGYIHQSSFSLKSVFYPFVIEHFCYAFIWISLMILVTITCWSRNYSLGTQNAF